MSTLFHSLDNSSLPESKSPRGVKILLSVLTGFLGLVVLVGIFVYLFVVGPAGVVLASVKKLQSSAGQVSVYLKNQDLGGMKNQLGVVKSDLDSVGANLEKMKWLGNLPYVKNYYADGVHGLNAAGEVLAAGNLAITGITPYADIIGLKNMSAAADGTKTAQDRINFILNTLEKLQPQLAQIGTHLENAKNEVADIDPSRYPETFQGQPVRSELEKGKILLDEAAVLTNEARPLLEAAPYMLGMDAPRRYLVIFQNDAELRPTGGFMTAYAVIQVNKGKISTLESGDMYSLDKRFTKKITAPSPILKYLPKVPYWNLRDMNLSPDFKVSMDTFYPNYLTTGAYKVDGIISMDTQVLVSALSITGQIGVPGYGNFSANIDPTCNCPQAFYALELYADVEGPVVWDSVSGRIIAAPANYGQRKSFIGPMMYSILQNVMAQPKSKMANLFNTALTLISQKHIQFYYTDPKAQNAVEAFNMAGRIRPSDGDYLLVVDTNFAGAKTNTWVKYDADLKVNAGPGGTTNTLTLVYQNPQSYFVDPKTNLKLNGVFRDWLRVYLPKGSKLVSADGFETGQNVSDDLGKTVIEGFFTLTPKNNRTITLKYSTPVKSSPYHLLLQKQGGSKNFSYRLTVNNQKQPEIILDGDKDILVSY